MLPWKNTKYYIFLGTCVSARELSRVRVVSQHAPYYIICGLSLAVPCFSTLSHKRHDFRKNVIEHKISILIFFITLSETFLIRRRMQRDIVINVKGLCVKYLLLLSHFNETLIFWIDFRRKIKCQIASKSVQAEPSFSMQTDGWMGGRTGVTKLIVFIRNLAKRLKRPCFKINTGLFHSNKAQSSGKDPNFCSGDRRVSCI